MCLHSILEGSAGRIKTQVGERHEAGTNPLQTLRSALMSEIELLSGSLVNGAVVLSIEDRRSIQDSITLKSRLLQNLDHAIATEKLD